MQRRDLTELAGDPNFISGIYNYCDRWCERCSFTARCLLYATEQADSDLADSEARDINNEKFWRKLRAIFAETSEMIAEWAAEAGVDLQAVDVAEEIAEHERELEEVEENELAVATRNYATSVEDWFKQEFADEENVYDDAASNPQPSEEGLTIRDAVEVIRWYQFFIAVKSFRALSGDRDAEGAPGEEDDFFGANLLTDAEVSDDEDFDYDAVVAKTARMDANGSAKIALIAMDRSISAWRALRLALPEKSDSIKAKLIELDRLRRLTEQRFPQARDFIRPGFDEGFSEFVS